MRLSMQLDQLGIMAENGTKLNTSCPLCTSAVYYIADAVIFSLFDPENWVEWSKM